MPRDDGHMSTELREVAELLFGAGADELIEKMEPTQSDLATHERKKRAATAALSGVGAAAGAGGLVLSGKELRHGFKQERAAAPKAGRLKAVGRAIKGKKVAAALLPLEVAGLGGELMATKILHGDTKKPAKQLVAKDLSDIPSQASSKVKHKITEAAVTSASRAGGKGLEYTKVGAGKLRRLPNKVKTHNTVEKRDIEITWEGEIAKADQDKQQLFGWASVVEIDGEPVVDLQGDFISPDEMEKAAYEYVVKSRKGGDMHLRNNWEPISKSDMIESFVVTDEKKKAMGLPEAVPTGWWVGFHVRDDDIWAKVKSGERTGFSIHGRGKRTPQP